MGNWTPPKDNALNAFTFSITSGTVVPTNITGPTGAPRTPPITINGQASRGFLGLASTGYPGTIVGGSIFSITNTSSPFVITLPLGASTNGLVTGDTVTISNVIDLTMRRFCHDQSPVDCRHCDSQRTHDPVGSFQLIGNPLPGDNNPMSGGSWIDGTDVAVKVIVPDTKSNATLPNGDTPTNLEPHWKDRRPERIGHRL